MIFDLESAITNWKKDLLNQIGVEPGDLEEMESHLRDSIEDLIFHQRLSEEQAFKKALRNGFENVEFIAQELYRERSLKYKSSRSTIKPKLSHMLPNYVRIGFRNIFRNKTDSAINIVGLTVSITAAILIFQYITFENSYDRFFENNERIYRVSAQSFNVDDNSFRGRYASTFYAVAPDIKKEIPEIEASTRLYSINGIFTAKDNNPLRETDLFYAEADFFDVFSYPLLNGNPKDLDVPDVIFLSESTKLKYFGEQDALGQKIRVSDNQGFEYQLEVRGIYPDFPKNSHLKANALLPLKNFVRSVDANNFFGSLKISDVRWRLTNFHQYVLLKKGINHQALQPKLDDFIEHHRGVIDRGRGVKNEFFLQSVTDIHLSEKFNAEILPKGDKNIVLFLRIIFVVVLMLGWINYINLSTAKSINRAKEVGIRKVIGSTRKQLVWKFFSESLLINLLSIMLSLCIVVAIVPFYHQLLGKEVFDYFHVNLNSWLIFVGILCGGIIISSFYPAFLLSSFKPVSILKGKFKNSKSGINLRKGLVTFQFLVSLILVVGIYTLYEQVKFMRNHELGFDIDKTLVVRAPAAIDSSTSQQLKILKEIVSGNSGFSEITVSSSTPGSEIVARTAAKNVHDLTGEDVFVSRIFCYDNFVEFYDFELIAGRTFSAARPADLSTIVLNRRAVEMFGFDSPESALNERIAYTLSDTFSIIGVVENFAQRGLQSAYDPIAIQMNNTNVRPYISLKVSGGSLTESLNYLEEKYTSFFPGDPFDYYFLDEYYNKQYQSEEQYGQVLGLFSVIAIVISSLGLLGLTAFMVRLKAKEVAIRKVLGASVQHIFGRLTKEYVVLIVLACLVGIPLSYYGIMQWLESFAFKISINVWMFIIPVVIIVAITFLIIGNLSLNAAKSNPVKSLKEE